MTRTLSWILYTAHATVTGGRAGHGRTSDGELEVNLRPPMEMGGDGGGTNPEQLFAIGYAACFQSALGVEARREKLDISDGAVNSSVALGPYWRRRVWARRHLGGTAALDRAGDRGAPRGGSSQVCPYSNATRGNINVTLEVLGASVAGA